jgi:hypothetical protein
VSRGFIGRGLLSLGGSIRGFALEGYDALRLAAMLKMRLQDECSRRRFADTYSKNPVLTSLQVARSPRT